MPLLLIILVLLWFFGYIRIPWLVIPTFPLFEFNGRVITFYDLIIAIIIVWIISFLPSPIREIVGLLLVLWLLSTFGILSIAGLALPQLILIAVIIGVGISVFK